ncbi:MAG: phosphodiester glycosidase family protein [Clostridia bacterium]|nr:phosphodiester glycosidase family protein [Clostridia bacterium]
MKIIKNVSWMRTERGLKAVVRTKKPTYKTLLSVADKTFADSFNDKEPYDKKTHVFYLPDTPAADTCLTFRYKRKKKNKRYQSASFLFGDPAFADRETLLREYDSGVTPVETETETLCDGVIYTHSLCKDKTGAPVHVFLLEVDSRKATLYVGTPGDGYESRKVRAKVPAMLDAAVKNGVNAVAAVNADFFDIFGDYSPSGLCVKNGRVIANADSARPFIGIKKDGTPVIASLAEDPALLPTLSQAAAGLQMLVKDGAICDFAPLEPFGFVRHPRTAAGVTKDGRILLLVVDGRIPAYSNGATLTDLAKLLLARGADRAVNLDGGGSSIVYTKKNGEFLLRSNPADLLRPNAKLIRKEFNCLLVSTRSSSSA